MFVQISSELAGPVRGVSVLITVFLKTTLTLSLFKIIKYKNGLQLNCGVSLGGDRGCWREQLLVTLKLVTCPQ